MRIAKRGGGYEDKYLWGCERLMEFIDLRSRPATTATAIITIILATITIPNDLTLYTFKHWSQT
ncbi:MAG: hypothetical protein LZ167_05910 [Thaumarchaeota archaeon]|jgi:hypothetical protein|nr:hypothetical protein [Candidatus Geocrenenecus arthurdayi]